MLQKDAAEVRKLSTMPKATFYQNLKKLTRRGTFKRRQGSDRPRALNQNDEKSVCQKALVAFEINFVNNPRGSNIKKR